MHNPLRLDTLAAVTKVGRLAQLMGGAPAFESGKADLAHLLILPALASESPQRIERLVIPTPDSRNQQTIAKLKELERHRIFCKRA